MAPDDSGADEYGLGRGFNVLPAPSLASSISLAFSKLTSML